MCILYEKSLRLVLAWSKKHQSWVEIDFDSDFAQRVAATHEERIFPGGKALITVSEPGQWPHLAEAQWGFERMRPLSEKRKLMRLHNARNDTMLREKPSMWKSAFAHRRCIVPATAYCEQVNQRWLRFRPRSGEVLAFAGLWEPSSVAGALPNYTVCTSEPNDLVESAGHDRMPVILAEKDLDLWLDPTSSQAELAPLLSPCPDDWLEVEDIGPTTRPKERKEEPQGSLF